MLPLHLYQATTPALRQTVTDLIQTTYAQAYPGNDYRQSVASLDSNISTESFILFDTNAAVALGTISIMYNDGGTLPSETLLGLDRPEYLPENVAEVGRTAKNMVFSHSPLDRYIFPSLVIGTYYYLAEQNYPGFVCSVKRPLLASLQWLGMRPTILQQGFLQANKSFGGYTDSETYYIWVETRNVEAGLTSRGLLNWVQNGTLTIHTFQSAYVPV